MVNYFELIVNSQDPTVNYFELIGIYTTESYGLV